ncbi:unnamed protein product [Clonostachys chloroleuca]|uniref:Mitochondrial chaperone BCS1-like ATPase lid domain-containing protein n=1 Tax=Clonostachys chloroleuca TaxID=1926264 RepID=A0AA35PY79_9HYPO|nr:unnamed protein product [Clonostachys chloroleuca]
MTTNHPEKLDDALTRPGRVDLKIAFQLANRSMANKIYQFILNLIVEVLANKGAKMKKMEELAKTFTEKVPEFVFSPAEVVTYLQQYWDSPADAVEHCDQWVDDLQREKKVKKCAMGKGA